MNRKVSPASERELMTGLTKHTCMFQYREDAGYYQHFLPDLTKQDVCLTRGHGDISPLRMRLGRVEITNDNDTAAGRNLIVTIYIL